MDPQFCPPPAYAGFALPAPAASTGALKWGKYKYTRMDNSDAYHNPHLTSQALPEVLAFLKLYDVQVLAVIEGRMFVSKKFPLPRRLHGRISSGPGEFTAANDGPLRAPLPYWQMLCQTLLDYAVNHGYEESANEQKHRPE